MLAAAGNTTATAAGSTSPAAAPGPGGCHGDVVVNIDEKQPLICRADHILTIDTVGIVFWGLNSGSIKGSIWCVLSWVVSYQVDFQKVAN